MSPSVAVAPLTSAEIVDVRRFCGYPPPNAFRNDPVEVTLAGISPEYVAVVKDSFLVPLRLLEADIPAARAKLSISSAAVFTRNPREVEEREALFRDLRMRLCATLGLDSGPFLGLAIPAVFVV